MPTKIEKVFSTSEKLIMIHILVMARKNVNRHMAVKNNNSIYITYFL
jgi:hypothetical protein